MRHIQIALSAALVVVLVFIAYELHRIDRALQPSGILTGAVVQALSRPPETREQRNERLRREQRELEEDIRAVWTDPATSRVPKRR